MKNSVWLPAVLILVLATCFSPLYARQEVISWQEAGNYVGREVVVEGVIVRTFNSGRACFLNFHPDYQRYLSLVIFASDFSKFPSETEKHFLNKKVRARGRVLLYRGRPEIILDSPAQITVVGELPGNGNQELEAASGKENNIRSGSVAGSVREISWEEAAGYYGQTVWVRGTVVAANNTGKVCFLNFHRNWKRYFTAVIFASDFDRFPQPPEKLYLNREVRVFGRVREYQGKPEIIVESPEQIEIIR
ncbi:MAG: OB-fold nucleic acid binding domain-containing protein [Candidatus Saccharicenans sp.]|nr:OB-fold nucleic acid binding domain-containing protein [Candidatus Saccharicenans sp.]